MKLSPLVALALSVATFGTAAAQNTSRLDVAIDYNFIHSNAPPGGCGCFNWNGGSVSGAWRLSQRVSVVGEFGGVHAGSEAGTSISPTMVTYLFGPRFEVLKHPHHVVPFGEVLLGVAHATNSYFPTGTTSTSTATDFAVAAGGGIDIPVSRRVTIRPIAGEYLLTRFPNNVNGRQNNTRISAGIVFRFKHQ